MIGEIRDLETAQIAVQSGAHRPLVLSTVHTNDAAGTVNRLLDMGVEDYLLTSTVIGIEAQRLGAHAVPALQGAVHGAPEMVEHTGIGRFAGGGPVTLWHAKGCGHVLAYRLHGPRVDHRDDADDRRAPRARDEARDSIELKAQAVRDGMVTMYEDGLRRPSAASRRVEEVLRRDARGLGDAKGRMRWRWVT